MHETLVIDPHAAGFVSAVSKHNCRNTLGLHADRVRHFETRMAERGDSPDEILIVLINVDSGEMGATLADALMPGHDWQVYRDRDEVPFARGLAGRAGIQQCLDVCDADAAEKLTALAGRIAVVVIDHGAAEVFESCEAVQS